MRRRCNKCRGTGRAGSALTANYAPRPPCSRCGGTGMMDRVTKSERRARRLDRYCSIKE